MTNRIQLNQIAKEICERLVERAERLRIAVHANPDGSRVIDCGVGAPGGLEAGRLMAEVCMAGLGTVEFPVTGGVRPAPAVSVRTDQPLLACMAGQYAGWRISQDGYFAMGSGPMRALAHKEPLTKRLGGHDKLVTFRDACQ